MNYITNNIYSKLLLTFVLASILELKTSTSNINNSQIVITIPKIMLLPDIFDYLSKLTLREENLIDIIAIHSIGLEIPLQIFKL